MEFVFYDVETTGTSSQFDQILQCAAIHTDAELNEIDRFETRCRLLPHVVPASNALRVNQVSADQLFDPALPSHYEAVTRVYKRFQEWSPAIFIGYNSIRFDEEFIRHEFYKNLFPAYLTNHNNNGRTDVMRAVMAASLYESGAIIVPTNDHGKQTFKLEQVAASNGCSSETAHDALDDSLSTLCLARLLSKRAPDIWSAFMRLSRKAAVRDYLIDELVVWLSEKHRSWCITRIGEREDRDAYQYVFTLNCDPEEFSKISDADLEKRLDKSQKPVRAVKANAAPILMPCDQVPSNAQSGKIDINEAERRAKWLRNNESLCRRLVESFEKAQKKYRPGIHVEQQLYDKLVCDDDEVRMESFHKAPWEERVAITETFTDPRLRELGLRLIYFEHPEVLNTDARSDMDISMAERLVGNCESLPCGTLPKAIEKIEQSMTEDNPREKTFLGEHRESLVKRLDSARTILTRMNR